MSKHTDGPWSIGGPNIKEEATVGIHGPGTFGYVICDMHSDGYPDDEQAANAQLIAEAPELLAVLEKSIVDLANLFFELETGKQPSYDQRAKIIQLAKPGTLLGDMTLAAKKARGEA
ncbi:hypothetical protein KLEP174_gp40 [Pseudomonas phage vB_PcuM_ KLEP17-4]|nr:hypothetical protein KLEP174_gp40 [Pseudomonas phage vB_PcuM_ KLEP17-4]